MNRAGNRQDQDLIWIALAVLAPRIAGLYSMNLFDDAFITFRHAVNFAAGRGLVFNEGSGVLGTTSPLFALLLAGAAILGVAPPLASVALGIAADVGTALLAFTILKRDVGRAAGVAFALCFAMDPHIVRVAVGGMESSLFFLGTLIWARLLAGRRAGPALLLSSALVFVRPEAGLLGLLSLAMLWQWRGSRGAGQWTAAAAAVVTIGVVWLWLTYGALLPQSIASKGRRVGGSLFTVVQLFFFPEDAYGYWVLTGLGLIGIRWAVSASSTVRWHLAWTVGYVGSYLLARPHMWTWYGLPVYGAKTLLVGVTLGMPKAPWARFAAAVMVPRVAASISVAGAVALIAIAGPSPVRRGVYSPLAKWCEANVKPGQTIAAGDIGAIGYYSSGFIYDLAGLVWPERWEYDQARHVIEQKRPDFIFAEVSDYWSELFDPESELRQLYRPERRFSRYGKSDPDPGPADLAHRWTQDYVIFRRGKALGD